MRKLSLFVCLFVCLLNVNAQECGFVPPEIYETYDDTLANRSSNSTSVIAENYCINVCFRIVRDDNGTNAAISPTIIPQVLAQLNSKYNPHGITFNQVGTFDYINNSSYNSYLSGNSPANIPNCLNIYFIKNFSTLGESYGGIASFGTLRATIKGSHALLNFTVPHEVGHALNLLHTFQCTNGFNNIQSCTENPLNSSGCDSKGDKICDTPADYDPLTYNTTNWPSYAIGFYNPDKQNIMSYWSTKNKFSNEQGVRMKNAIIGAYQLQSIRSYQCASIAGTDYVCPYYGFPDYYTFSVPTYGTPVTFSWSVNGNLQIVGSTTGSSIQVLNTDLDKYITTATITVVINGNITITKTVNTKCFIKRVVGLYDWVSADYGNMGLIVPNDIETPFESYSWEITEEANSTNTNNNKIKAFFVGTTNNSSKFISTTNQAIVNWGNLSKSYLIICHGITASGEQVLINRSFVDVGDPKNNPCFKNAIQSVIAPNPINNGIINVVLNKPEQTTPCNYKNLDEPQYFNSQLDKINNSITIFDYNGNEVYRNVFETNQFSIDNANLISGNNYIVNLFTNEGGFKQQVIIVE